MKVYRTGIIQLDSQLGGGIPAGSVVLILEEPGAGGDVFSFHFAVEGVKNDEKVFYLITDDTEEEIRENIVLYFNIEEELLDKIHLCSFITKHYRKKEKEGDIRKLLRTGTDPLNIFKNRLIREEYDRIIINNLTYFIENYKLSDVISLIDDLSEYTRNREAVALLLMTKGMFEPRIETTMKHHSDGVIELTLREVENEIQRRLKIVKFKRILVPKAVLRYDLTDKGIKMESVMRVL